MIEIKAPYNTNVNHFVKIFLGGSIEMDKAEKWQDKLVAELKQEPCICINPRRDDWDSTWKQDPTVGTEFNTQVNWEINNILNSDVVVFYFDPNTVSPITLLELGLCAGTNHDSFRSLVVFCSPEYFRYGNVKIVCDRFNIPVYSDWDGFVNNIKNEISDSYKVKIRQM